MNRRTFLEKSLAAGVGASLLPSSLPGTEMARGVPQYRREGDRFLDRLHKLSKAQLFEQYLPFWENGGYDKTHGGFMCYLHTDGTVQDDRKDIWYQGRGIWVYAYLYNEIDKDPKWLERACRTRDFMVKHMHRGDGTWITTVNRQGKPVSSIAVERSNNIYGALFAAVGLIQLAKATGSEEDLALARLSLGKSIQRYEDPDYAGVQVTGLEAAGLRAQGHSFMFVWVLSQYLERQEDPILAVTLAEHLTRLKEDFWNADYGISNEYLFHDYTRIPSHSGFMVPGHSIEAQWMCMEEALRQGDRPLARLFAGRMRRLIEMSWDYVFGGTCDTGYSVFPADDRPAGPVLGIKTMWAQTEVVIGCVLSFQHFREAWSREWMERSWNYLQETMPTGTGVWRQAVDRQGNDKQREGISPYRRGNFHQPRCLMFLLRVLGDL